MRAAVPCTARREAAGRVTERRRAAKPDLIAVNAWRAKWLSRSINRGRSADLASLGAPRRRGIFVSPGRSARRTISARVTFLATKRNVECQQLTIVTGAVMCPDYLILSHVAAIHTFAQVCGGVARTGQQGVCSGRSREQAPMPKLRRRGSHRLPESAICKMPQCSASLPFSNRKRSSTASG